MMSVNSNFNCLCGHPHGAGPPPPSTCVHLSLTPSPSCGRHKWMAPYEFTDYVSDLYPHPQCQQKAQRSAGGTRRSSTNSVGWVTWCSGIVLPPGENMATDRTAIKPEFGCSPRDIVYCRCMAAAGLTTRRYGYSVAKCL